MSTDHEQIELRYRELTEIGNMVSGVLAELYNERFKQILGLLLSGFVRLVENTDTV